jgi:hypothetical protein
MDAPLGPFRCADKPAEKDCWLIYWERKILFQLKNQAEKPDEQGFRFLTCCPSNTP